MALIAGSSGRKDKERKGILGDPWRRVLCSAKPIGAVRDPRNEQGLKQGLGSPPPRGSSEEIAGAGRGCLAAKDRGLWLLMWEGGMIMMEAAPGLGRGWQGGG